MQASKVGRRFKRVRKNSADSPWRHLILDLIPDVEYSIMPTAFQLNIRGRQFAVSILKVF